MHLQTSTINFLNDLALNNNTEWFRHNKKYYEAAKSDFYVFTQALITELSKFDSEVANLNPSECIFRINRDIRFSKDKSPYKNNFGCFIAKGGKKTMLAGYYLHIAPQTDCFFAGGMYMPANDKLAMIRQEIDYNLPQFESILANSSFKLHFNALSEAEGKAKLPPKGYDKNHKAIELLKLKSFVVSKKFDPSLCVSENFLSTAAEVFRALKPLNDFLNSAVHAS